jgi:dolichyl-phosphate beta-glucosyltransferase
MSKVIIVVPCYNEEKRFPIDRFEEYLSHEGAVDFVLVKDGSRDGTLAVLTQFAGRFPGRVEVLNLEMNGGKAEAVRRGVMHAIERSPFAVGFWDADLATPLESIGEFADLLARRTDIELVTGARVRLLGRHIHRYAWRHYLGRFSATLISLTLQLPVYDTQCGAKMFRCSGDVRKLFAEPFLSRWLFDVEILARLIVLRGRTAANSAENVIYEFPLQRWEDVQGSSISGGSYLRSLRDLWKIRAKYLA